MSTEACVWACSRKNIRPTTRILLTLMASRHTLGKSETTIEMNTLCRDLRVTPDVVLKCIVQAQEDQIEAKTKGSRVTLWFPNFKRKYGVDTTPDVDTSEQERKFNEWWLVMPKRQNGVNKVKTRQAWHKLNPDGELFDLIMLDVQSRYIFAKRDFIHSPSNYLNNRVWENEGVSDEELQAFNDIPYEKIVETYRTYARALRPVQALTPELKGLITKFWLAKPANQTIERYVLYFRTANKIIKINGNGLAGKREGLSFLMDIENAKAIFNGDFR